MRACGRAAAVAAVATVGGGDRRGPVAARRRQESPAPAGAAQPQAHRGPRGRAQRNAGAVTIPHCSHVERIDRPAARTQPFASASGAALQHRPRVARATQEGGRHLRMPAAAGGMQQARGGARRGAARAARTCAALLALALCASPAAGRVTYSRLLRDDRAYVQVMRPARPQRGGVSARRQRVRACVPRPAAGALPSARRTPGAAPRRSRRTLVSARTAT
jgi:hypothetical protein